jgi:Kef-type K+ transport system membrane component KefB
MVAFLLGGALGRETLVSHGREIIALSVAVVVASGAVVAGGLLLVGAPVAVALMLGGISAATDPAATRDVARQSGHAGPFTQKLLGIVAIDDAWGLLAFSLALTAAGVSLGHGVGEALLLGLYEVGGAVVPGAAIGLPAAYLTGRLKPGEPTLIEAVGVVLLTAGAALYLDVSFLLAGMVCGAVVVNFARHHDQAFHEIELIEWPFMLLFFVMAGASLDLDALGAAGLVAGAYIGLRALGRILGGLIGSRLIGDTFRQGALTGMALMPQAGVAIGMSLVAAERFPQYGEAILATAIASTIVFEVFGPLLTQHALRKASDAEPSRALAQDRDL